MALEIQQLRQRIDDILYRVAEAPESRASMISTGLDELRHVVSEFVASGEELYHKIEELMEVRATLEGERRQYHDLFDYAPDAHVITDADVTIRLANRAAATLLQVRPEALVSQSLLLFVGESDRETLQSHVADFAKRLPEIAEHWRVSIRPRQEESFSVIATVTPIIMMGLSEVNLHWVLREVSMLEADRKSVV